MTFVNDQGAAGEDKSAYIGYVEDGIEALAGGQWILLIEADSHKSLLLKQAVQKSLITG